MSAAAAGSAVAPAAVPPLDALLGSEPPAPVWGRTPCRLCGVGCGLLVGIERGRAVAMKGDPASPATAGMACAKGYHAAQALYGRDRITRAKVRRGGVLVDVPLAEALDIVAAAVRDTVRRHGKDSVALYGSAQWTIPDAYVASKLFKGALGTNNVESSARLYAASAISGLESTFGLDGSIGSYEDIDQANVFVLWDTNLAESDPVLFSRMLDRRRADPGVRIIDLTTRTTRTSYAADRSVLHTPHAGLSIANAVCHEIIARRWVHREFVDRHVALKRERADSPQEPAEDRPVGDDAIDVTWDDYVAFLAGYAPERVQGTSGVPADALRWLASLYGDRSRKVMTVWDAGVHRSIRGAWLNNVLYNIHLLVGKIASPGNGPLCLTGQPNGGCGVHDAGTLTHTLPRGVVHNEADRRRAAEIWGVPIDRIDPRPTHTALSMFQALDRGDIRFLWIQATNPMVSLPNAGRYRRAAAKADRFIVVSEAYPTPTTDIADVVLPAALWIEREGVIANVERRAQHFAPMVTPPGDATADAWLMIEVGRRLGHAALFPWDERRYVEQIWEEYSRFHTDPRTAVPPLAELRAHPGVRWPFVGGRETVWRYNTAHDPATNPARGAYDFYGHDDGRARIWLRSAEPPAEAPNRDYPFWLGTGPVLEHWGGGSITQRIPALHRSIPRAYVELNRADASRLRIRHGETVRLVTPRGALEIEARIDYRAQPPRGQVFVPTFDEATPVNTLTLDAECPISGQPGAALCAARVERIAAGAGR